MITKTKSNDWVDDLFKNTDELNSGSDDISWIFDFLGWGKYAKRTRRT